MPPTQHLVAGRAAGQRRATAFQHFIRQRPDFRPHRGHGAADLYVGQLQCDQQWTTCPYVGFHHQRRLPFRRRSSAMPSPFFPAPGATATALAIPETPPPMAGRPPTPLSTPPPWRALSNPSRRTATNNTAAAWKISCACWRIGLLDTLTYNGSIVVMYPSQYATNYWIGPGTYYNPPNRQWGFDVNFMARTSQPATLDTAGQIRHPQRLFRLVTVPVRYRPMALNKTWAHQRQGGQFSARRGWPTMCFDSPRRARTE